MLCTPRGNENAINMEQECLRRPVIAMLCGHVRRLGVVLDSPYVSPVALRATAPFHGSICACVRHFAPFVSSSSGTAAAVPQQLHHRRPTRTVTNSTSTSRTAACGICIPMHHPTQHSCRMDIPRHNTHAPQSAAGHRQGPTTHQNCHRCRRPCCRCCHSPPPPLHDGYHAIESMVEATNQ